MIGTTRALTASKSKWHGAVMLIGQPSEETIDGAGAMLPDTCTSDSAGRTWLSPYTYQRPRGGNCFDCQPPALASSTSVDVVLRGIGAHGARPQEGKDPIVMAGEFIVQLQTIVSRQENPRDPAPWDSGSMKFRLSCSGWVPWIPNSPAPGAGEEPPGHAYEPLRARPGAHDPDGRDRDDVGRNCAIAALGLLENGGGA